MTGDLNRGWTLGFRFEGNIFMRTQKHPAGAYDSPTLLLFFDTVLFSMGSFGGLGRYDIRFLSHVLSVVLLGFMFVCSNLVRFPVHRHGLEEYNAMFY